MSISAFYLIAAFILFHCTLNHGTAAGEQRLDRPFKQFNHIVFTESTTDHEFLHITHMHLLVLAKRH